MIGEEAFAQWFRTLGRCKCGRAATGELMSNRNASMGPYCQRCAETAIRKSHRLGKFVPDAIASPEPPP